MQSRPSRSLFRHLAVFAVAASAFVLGCETLDEDGPDNVLQISPSYVSRKLNQSVVLTARGGANYRWSVADSSYGSINATVGESVIYTVRKVPAAGAEFVQTITLTGTTDLNPTGNASNATATASVRHVPASADPTALSITGGGPATVGGTPITLTATGGDGANYEWSIANPAIGYLSGTTGRQITYRATDTVNATQTIRVSSARKTFQIAVIHAP